MQTLKTKVLHGFCNASKKAYGELQSICSRHTIYTPYWKVKVKCQKPRVSPFKQITIPRLEFNGAFLLVRDVLRMDLASVHLWSDSTVTISWIHREPRELKTFVAN
ncbi:DUF1758 domain-containing protein [Caerostris extrusa]|uniref:DUF1758 domain-containing protein n=1 Tax=Caerostris extrusa TaxID=172846 RepID=A0AAV4RGP0_CAEEX|nr:DUF1758 domain-containing protein [Caerostris extrusa]